MVVNMHVLVVTRSPRNRCGRVARSLVARPLSPLRPTNSPHHPHRGHRTTRCCANDRSARYTTGTVLFEVAFAKCRLLGHAINSASTGRSTVAGRRCQPRTDYADAGCAGLRYARRHARSVQRPRRAARVVVESQVRCCPPRRFWRSTIVRRASWSVARCRLSLPPRLGNDVAIDRAVQYQDVGTTLTIIPTINQDKQLHQRADPAGGEQSDDQNDSGRAHSVIPTREATTRAIIRDGQTVVIGGLIGNTPRAHRERRAVC